MTPGDSPGHFPTPGGRFEDQFGSVQADFGPNSSPAGSNSSPTGFNSSPAGSKSSPAGALLKRGSGPWPDFECGGLEMGRKWKWAGARAAPKKPHQTNKRPTKPNQFQPSQTLLTHNRPQSSQPNPTTPYQPYQTPPNLKYFATAPPITTKPINTTQSQPDPKLI